MKRQETGTEHVAIATSKCWKGNNELIGSCKKKNKCNPINFIRSNPNEDSTSDPKEICNIFNRYFATVGWKLAYKIPQTINTFSDYLDPSLNHTFFFDPIIPEDTNLENFNFAR